MKRILISALMATSFSTTALANFTEGLAAAKKGNYAQALKEFQPLAVAACNRNHPGSQSTPFPAQINCD